ncbi:MAG: glycosyltransferase family 2 protein [Acidimicrobiales bacterium]
MTNEPGQQSTAASRLLADPSTLRRCELTVIMPVYNEEASLPGCAASWLAELDQLGIDYRLLLIDDGSSDGTAGVLADLEPNDRVLAVSKSNEGHGPTILAGYRLGVRTSDWVFQVDSDDEIPANAFPDVWQARDGVDAVFGIRTGRDQSIDRRFISLTAAMTSRLLFRSRVTDVNVPYRLIRSEALAPILDALPDDTFAPNVVISGALGRNEAGFAEVEVPHEHRQAGEVSIVGWGAMRAAARSFGQTVRLVRTV